MTLYLTRHTVNCDEERVSLQIDFQMRDKENRFIHSKTHGLVCPCPSFIDSEDVWRVLFVVPWAVDVAVFIPYRATVCAAWHLSFSFSASPPPSLPPPLFSAVQCDHVMLLIF